jgi:hypothetical protein
MSGICDTFDGSITGDLLEFNHEAIPAPDTLLIRMTRGEHRIADELRKQFGGFKRVIIDVDGERHDFGADSLIRLLEGYEGARDTSRWHELFGTPERAARTLANNCHRDGCIACPALDADCNVGDYDKLLEWLRGDA